MPITAETAMNTAGWEISTIIQKDASALSFDVKDIVEDILNEAFGLVDSCDATEDGFADI